MYYRCPECGDDENLYVLNPQIVSYRLSGTGNVELADNADIGEDLLELTNVQCNSCGNEGPADTFLLRSLTLRPSPKSDSEETLTLTAIRADHLETCPGCSNDKDIICITTNDSDEFQPMIMWCPCGDIWNNLPESGRTYKQG